MGERHEHQQRCANDEDLYAKVKQQHARKGYFAEERQVD